MASEPMRGLVSAGARIPLEPVAPPSRSRQALAEDRACAGLDFQALIRLVQSAGGRLLAIRVVIVLVLLMAAQVYDGSLHAISHWVVLGLYAAGAVVVGVAERRGGGWADGFSWAGTTLNAGLAAYVIVEHIVVGGGPGGGAADTVSRLPAFLLLLQTGLSLRVGQAVLFAGIVTPAWGAAILFAHLDPEGMLGPHVDLVDQVPGLVTFAAASLVVIDGVSRLRRAVEGALRLEHERTLLARFVPDTIALDLARDGGLGDVRRRHACLMMLDIRGFSALSRTHPPEAMVRALLAVRALAQEAVIRHGGLVDKYVGDAVLAQFVVGPASDQARGGLACAGAIRAGIAALNAEREAAGDFPLRIVVALHAGDLLVGVFDDGVRAEYTVLGPAMNALARIEMRAKAAEIPIAASEDFLRLVGSPLPEGVRTVPVEEGPGAGAPALFSVEAADASTARTG